MHEEWVDTVDLFYGQGKFAINTINKYNNIKQVKLILNLDKLQNTFFNDICE